MRTPITIFGVRLDAWTRAEVLEAVRGWLGGTEPGRVIATVNAEFLVAAERDPVFRADLLRADLALADGIGPVWAASYLARPRGGWLRSIAQYVERGASIVLRPASVYDALPEKIPGSDLTVDLCRVAAEVKAPVFLLGAGPGIAEQAAEKLRTLVPGLKVGGTASGRAHGEDEAQCAAVRASGAGLLLVAFDAKDQLAWMHRNLSTLPGVRVAMGVGGTFDFLAGARDPRHRFGLAARQPPTWMRSLGLDWLWRLVTQPYRWRRVWTAFPVFSFMVLRAKARGTV